MKTPSNKKHLQFFIVFILILSVLITGCWNRRELDTLGIVLGVAIDKAQDPYDIEMTAQLIKVSNKETTSGPTNDDKQYWNLKEQGHSVFETVRKMTSISSRKLYWPHNQVIIFSKDLATEGVGPYIDYYMRDHETRLLAYCCISDKKGYDLLETEAELENLPAMEIRTLLEDYGTTSMTPQVDIKDFAENLIQKTKAAYLPLIGTRKIDDKNYIALLGTAVLKKDKYVGKLSEKETRGMLWVLGDVKSGIILVKCPKGKGTAELEIIRAKSKIIPEIKDGELQITVKIKEEGILGAQECTANLTDLSIWKELNKENARAIKQEVLSGIKKLQDLNADVFGFGESFHKKYPKIWSDIEDDWDDIFPELKIIVQVETNLTRSGKTTKPVVQE